MHAFCMVLFLECIFFAGVTLYCVCFLMPLDIIFLLYLYLNMTQPLPRCDVFMLSTVRHVKGDLSSVIFFIIRHTDLVLKIP